MTTTRPDALVVRALAKRDLRRFFMNPAGYIFIVLFMFLSGAAAFWRPRFFLNNLANLDQLNGVFPYLLMLFIPALTMGVWSEERRQGTDELMLTLPATELEIALGKNLAVFAVYLVALGLSTSHFLVLLWLGRPDAGLLVANYCGYALIGVALIPVGVAASLLAPNTPVAFTFGSSCCGILVGFPGVAGALNESLGRRAAAFDALEPFADMTSGVVGLRALLYFACFAAWFLYANVLLLGRLRVREQDRLAFWVHGWVRVASLALALGSVVVLTGRTHVRLDLSTDRLHSLSSETKHVIESLPADRPIVIQAFVSPAPPASFVQIRQTVLDVLRDIAAVEDSKITIAVQPTESHSDQARMAREQFGITSRQVSGSYSEDAVSDVFLGAVFTSGTEEQVIPFFDRGTSVEYEIARAIRTVSRGRQKRLGVIDSDTKMFGGIDYASRQVHAEWKVLTELRKQYDVIEIQPAGPIDDRLDALLVVLPSRLSRAEMDLVEARIRRGTPTMILVDPLPVVDMQLAPAAQIAERLNPYGTEATVTRNFGDSRKMLNDLGVNWVPARIAWDTFNPHPDMANLPREAVFVGPGNSNSQAFNPHHPAALGLQELLLLYPGELTAADESSFDFAPLVQTGPLSGYSSFFDVVRPGPQGLAINPAPPHTSAQAPAILAAEARARALDPSTKRAASNVIVVADLDLISDSFFEIRAAAPVNATFDNITFFLNAIDYLAHDEASITLRSRRVRHRTLERVELRTRRFIEQRTRDEGQAEREAGEALAAARERLSGRVKELEGRRDLDAQARQILVRNVQELENRRFKSLEAAIEQDKNARITATRETMERQVQAIRGAIRLTAVLVPPIPVLLVGAVIFVRRRSRARESAGALRRLSGRDD